jgi:hypothetical protein
MTPMYLLFFLGTKLPLGMVRLVLHSYAVNPLFMHVCKGEGGKMV